MTQKHRAINKTRTDKASAMVYKVDLVSGSVMCRSNDS